MKTTILKLGTLLTILILVSCSSDDNQITGSGTIVSQERTVNIFSKIYTPSSVNVDIVYGATQNITISADDNVIDLVETSVNNSILTIDLEQGNYNNIEASVIVTIPSLVDLQNTGSGNISVSNFIDLNSLTIANSGSGSIEANGSATNLNLHISGSGNFNGFDFVSENCTVNNVGSGSSEVYCNNTLSGTNSGSGSVFYKGTASVNIANTGSGNIINSN